MVEVGDLVFAHIKGFRPWPARVMGQANKAGKYSVFFFGTYQTGELKKQDIHQYSPENISKWGKDGKNKAFNRALKEIQENPKDISENQSFHSVPAPTKPEAKAPKRPQHRKLYVQVKGTEDMIEIDVDKNRPKNFASKEEANDWEEKTLRDILRFKKLVEDGKFVPEEVVQRLQAKENKTEQEVQIVESWKYVQLDRKEKIEWLKTEATLAQYDLDIRKCLSLENPQLDQCMEILMDMNNLKISQLMLKKQPQVVKSIHKICSYVGTSDTTENNEKTKRIRDTANAITNKMADCFDGGSEKDNFYPFFTEQVKKFQDKTSSWPSEKITYLTTEEN